VEILLVDNNVAEEEFLARSLREVPFAYQLSFVNDGAAARAFLQGHAPYTDAPTPDLIVIDIHLSQESGWDVLAWVRATPAPTRIPVVMLTHFFAPVDQAQRDALHPTLCLVNLSTSMSPGSSARVLRR
jgi:CheY-like chemotaxis protein